MYEKIICIIEILQPVFVPIVKDRIKKEYYPFSSHRSFPTHSSNIRGEALDQVDHDRTLVRGPMAQLLVF
jgi:hypothetical protein